MQDCLYASLICQMYCKRKQASASAASVRVVPFSRHERLGKHESRETQKQGTYYQISLDSPSPGRARPSAASDYTVSRQAMPSDSSWAFCADVQYAEASPQLSVPGTPTDYTLFSTSTQSNVLLCNNNGMFSPGLDEMSDRETTGFILAPQKLREGAACSVAI